MGCSTESCHQAVQGSCQGHFKVTINSFKNLTVKSSEFYSRWSKSKSLWCYIKDQGAVAENLLKPWWPPQGSSCMGNSDSKGFIPEGQQVPRQGQWLQAESSSQAMTRSLGCSQIPRSWEEADVCAVRATRGHSEQSWASTLTRPLASCLAALPPHFLARLTSLKLCWDLLLRSSAEAPVVAMSPSF